MTGDQPKMLRQDNIVRCAVHTFVWYPELSSASIPGEERWQLSSRQPRLDA